MASDLSHIHNPSVSAGKSEGLTVSSPTNTQTAASRLKDSLLGLPWRLISSSSTQTSRESEKETELQVIGSSEWLLVDCEDSPDMSSAGVAAAASSASTQDNLTPNSARKKLHNSSKPPHSASSGLGPRTNSHSSTATPPLGLRANSVSKNNKPAGSSSPHSTGTGPFQRKPSGRASRAANLEVNNGDAKRTRGVSPSQGRVGSPSSNSSSSSNSLRNSSKKKGILQNSDADNLSTAHLNHTPAAPQSDSQPSVHSNGHQATSSSTNASNSRSSAKKKGILQNSDADNSATAQPHHPPVQADSRPGIHSNGHPAQANSKSSQPTPPTSGTQVPGKNQSEEGEVSMSAFEKVRDTLRISRPKKKKAKGKLAYSIVVDPAQISTPEINLHEPDKYQDPFETSYAENGDTEKKMDHIFKPASIPHNKPEYCDHCGDMAWGLYRQVLKCSRCNFIAHRKCEGKVVIGCSLRLEQAILHHDKQVEDVERIAAREEVEEKKEKEEKPALTIETDAGPSVAAPSPDPVPIVPLPPLPSSPSPATPTTTTSSTSSSASSSNSQMLAEKTKLSRKIREYNRKTTPVHHIHIKSTFQATDPNTIEYHGFVRVHMHVQRPIHVSTAITRTSWYRLMRPVKERTLNDVDGYEIQTAFYLPLDTNRLVHIQNTTTTKELIQILLKKFCVTDNPKKFSLYEEYGSDCRRLFEEDRPLEISLDASVSHRNSKLVLRDNTYSTIQWDAFSAPELGNFIQILQREEELYLAKLTERFQVWKNCIQQTLKEKCMEEQAKKTKKTVSSRLSVARGRSSPKGGPKKVVPKSPKNSPKNSLKKSGAAKAS